MIMVNVLQDSRCTFTAFFRLQFDIFLSLPLVISSIHGCHLNPFYQWAVWHLQNRNRGWVGKGFSCSAENVWLGQKIIQTSLQGSKLPEWHCSDPHSSSCRRWVQKRDSMLPFQAEYDWGICVAWSPDACPGRVPGLGPGTGSFLCLT